MREARFILPDRDNAGRSLAELHNRLRADLARMFGGYTVYAGSGGWVDDDGHVVQERVHIYDVALADIPGNWQAELIALARRYAVEAGQHALYYRSLAGTVTIYDLGNPAKRKETA